MWALEEQDSKSDYIIYSHKKQLESSQQELQI